MSEAGANLTPGISRVPRGIVAVGGKIWPPAVVDRQGAPVVDGVLNRKGVYFQPGCIDPGELGAIEEIPGRWLFAGDFWQHFGHFLFESLSRLWALPMLQEPLDGILYIAPRDNGVDTVVDGSFQRRLLDLLGVDLPVRILSSPARVEELIVPRQGCGLGPLAAGTPEFREFIRHSFRVSVPPGGNDRLYLTRTAYGHRRGGIFAEHLIEERLSDEGYLAFSPERAPIEEQIAAYLGASKVVAPDSTALHVVGFVARPEQDLAIVLRRRDGVKDLMPQLVGFTGRRPLVIDRITAFLVRDRARNASWATYAELDLPAVGRDLAEAGFIDKPDLWAELPVRRRRRLIAYIERKLSCTLRPSDTEAEAAGGSAAKRGARPVSGAVTS